MKRGISCLSLLTLCILLLFSATAWAQTGQQLSGRVTNERNEPLIGVSVLVKGTGNGTITDTNGHYQLQLTTPNPVLVFSYLGFVRQEVPVNNRSSIDIVLQEEVESLQSLVVVGTRSQNHSVTETPVAIDIIPIQEITSTS